MTGDPERDKLNEMAARIRQAGGASDLQTPESLAERAEAARASRPAIDFIAAIMSCVGVGWFIDYKWGTAPWCAVGGLFVGFAVGLFAIWRTMASADKDEAK